jgi:hypothetical protein
MLTAQKYAEGDNIASSSPQTAQNAAPTPRTPDNRQVDSILEYLLTLDDDMGLLKVIRLASQPAVTSIKAGVVLDAISAAFELGVQKSKPDSVISTTPEPVALYGIDADVYRVQTQLLELVDDFLSLGNATGPVEAINDLLYRWLTTSATDLSRQTNRNQLHTVLELVNFLTALNEQNENLTHFIGLADQKGGQPNG